MTDREKLSELLKSFGLAPAKNDSHGYPQPDGEVVLLAKEGGVEGYYDFYASFKFDADGKFVSMGVWE